uniref:RNA polymerase sigma-70 region 2 domain-containing protein n=1 Tax=mine drainage metagenome TaxID=410659 RepID=E6PQB4_9ZZZZ
MRKVDAAAEDTARSIAAIWHIEAAKVIAHAARLTRDLCLAEDCAQDALVAALEHWPELGIPERPGAWLMTAAKRRALDHLRHEKLAEPRHAQLGHELDTQHAIAAHEFSEMVDARLDDDIGDDLLRLIFTACHPVLAPEARSALTLRVILGCPRRKSRAPISSPSPPSPSASCAPSARWPKRACRSKCRAGTSYTADSPQCWKCCT